MGLGGVAIAILPSIICLKLTFSDGLGGVIVSALASTMPNTLTKTKAISALTLRKSCFIVFN